MLPAEASVANPVDMLGGATAATYAAAIPHVLADPHVSACIVLFVPAVSATADEVARAVVETVERAESDKPVLAVIMSVGGDAGRAARRRTASRRSPTRSPPRARSAASRIAPPGCGGRRARCPRWTGSTAPGRRRSSSGRSTLDEDTWLDPAATRELLEAYGLPLVPERVATSVDEAVAAARELGFPAVVKTAAPGAHKTETGGIALDLADEEAVAAAAARIGPPVIVQPMLAGGAELLAGVVQDPVFGPLVAFGPGGVFAELIGEAAFRIAPLTDIDAEELVDGGKAGRLVAGLPRRAGGRPGGARRPRPAPRAARRGPSRGRGARPEPRARAARPLRRRRRPHPRAKAGRGGPHEELVARSADAAPA